MAITILDTPAAYSSMNDDLWYVASSTNSGTTNFKFIVDVYVDGALVGRSKVFPSPSGSYGVYNASPIVRSYVTNYFEPSGTSILVASNNKLKVNYIVAVGEEVSGVTTANMASGSFSAYNFYPPLFADILATNAEIPLVLSDYYNNLLIENFSDDWLTERNEVVDIEYGDNFLSVYIANAANEMKQLLKAIMIQNNQVCDKVNYSASVYLGDLLVTCYSLHSRNRTFGNMIGKGYSVRAAELEMNMVAEGYNACKCIVAINENLNAPIPIIQTIYKILWEGAEPQAAFKEIEEILI